MKIHRVTGSHVCLGRFGQSKNAKPYVRSSGLRAQGCKSQAPEFSILSLCRALKLDGHIYSGLETLWATR